ncbi:MAG TPA: ATP phosphoribosyltransferase regulatory subunit [Casimicrobium huifangae]|jgi:ATP phosphoribosyltransferase regulatory subunit|uniref:ATP phosphoribosyltransferase regulatory subunit n=1 Tax=Casimicrobium huifangae TaxID=2591109 RepID=UPI0012EBE636|nr:ATP phosphoribosyltransferase regulatory subunit [Casimicrobium huifangae]HOB01033.1 ATP phosphoribosyltransferase regulatory subunit [Casimicrobium huifangae]HQA32547.1 ATP phosphoribosyltransferase regulatory subunit [Casimicrobium huifangae]HQD65699.1 ATP phosphoribosyltransferase regulatory subunit [Casimicrobium huifangae]
MRKWVLPDYVEDVLPPEAQRMEATRRALLDSFAAAGYALVNPPLIEHLEALLTGTGRDLEHNTFKLIDPLSGKLLGVRPDITPQVARIDATYSGSDASTPRRYCYAGEVLRAEASIGSSRALTQVGAELFGDATVNGDVEIVRLMIASAKAAGAAPLLLDCGHVGVFKALAQHYELSPKATQAADAALAAKSSTALSDIKSLSDEARQTLATLTTLFGPAKTVLQRARAALPRNATITAALDQLEAVATAITESGAQCSLDLADLPGLDYHTGLVFVAYLQGTTHVVARGGRYDGVGEAFTQGNARARPATGFSFVDLRALAEVTA